MRAGYPEQCDENIDQYPAGHGVEDLAAPVRILPEAPGHDEQAGHHGLGDDESESEMDNPGNGCERLYGADPGG
jgi:hypothetical protein